jgi:MFS family permease
VTLLQRVENRLVNRNFARLWYGQAVSSVGDFAFNTTVTLWVAVKLGAGKSWAPAAVGGLLLAATAAIVVVGPIAGVWVDRWDRKRTMLATEVVRGAVAGCVALVSLVAPRDLPVGIWLTLIFVMVFLLNAASRFFIPARQVIIGQVVSGEADRTRAFGIGNATNATAGMIGPPLAAPLVLTAGVTWALAFNALSYVVSFVAIRSVQVPETAADVADAPAASTAKRDFWADFREGMHFLIHSKMLSILIIGVISQVAVGALNTLDVFFVTRNLHVSVKYFGLLSTGMGFGLIFGSLVASKVVARLGGVTTLWVTIIGAGLIYLLYTRQTNFAAGLVTGLLFMVPLAIMNTAMTPVTLKLIPQRLFGRVLSAYATFSQGTQMLSVALSGWLASSVMLHFHAAPFGVHVGPIDSILTVAGVLIVASGIYAFFTLPDGELAPAPAEPEAEVLAEPQREPGLAK